MRKALVRSSLISLLLLLVLVGIFVQNTIKSSYEDEIRNELQLGVAGFETMVDNHGFDNVDALAKEFYDYTNIRITVIDSDGLVLADSINDITTMDNHRYRSEVKEAFLNGSGSSERYSNTEKEGYMYYAQIVTVNDIEYIFRTAMPVHVVNNVYRSLFLALIISGVVSGAAAFVVAYKYNNRVIEPINDIVDVALDIADGDYGKAVYINSYEEVIVLSKALNKLSKNLQKSFRKITTRNAQLEAILHSFSNGILVCDYEGYVKYTNVNFLKILDIKDNIEKLNIYNFLFDEYIYSIINELKDSDDDRLASRDNIKFSDDTYRTYRGSLIKDEENLVEGFLLTVEDVTNIRKLETMRSNFATNVTHELKTPITCISGYTQTLMNGAIKDEKNALRFLGIINDETERLNLLIDDILTLSEIESDDSSEFMKPINLLPIGEDVVNLMKLKYPDTESVKIQIATDGFNKYTINGESNKIKQIMINLLDNSLRHTKEGHVQLSLGKADNKVVMKVIDTGIGIEKSHHDRIFERFYRVDKHRSRETGGTGLGLSIVKHLTLLHKGVISLKSKPGVGTSITIKFPALDDDI